MNNTAYQWRVRTICAAGDTSQPTASQFFQTSCAVPYGATTSTITHQSARLQWRSDVVNTVHEVYWRPVGNGEWTVIRGVSGKETVLANLANNTTYEWKVRTQCAEAIWSDFTDALVFRTECSTPQSLTALVVNTDAVELRWINAPNMYRADVRWRPVGTASWIEVTNLASAEYGLTAISPNTYYEWQVRAACSATEKSAYSASALFQTQCAVPTQLTQLGVGSNSISLGWQASTPVDLSYRVAGTTTWTVVRNLPATGYDLTGLATNTSYEWRVSGACAGGVSSDYSATRVFTTRCAPVTSLSTQFIYDSDLQLSWSGSEGWQYEVQWRLSGTSAWSVATGLTQATYILQNPRANATYEWRVRHSCLPAEASDYSPIQVYAVPCYTGYSLTSATVINTTSVQLAWLDKSPATQTELRWRASGTDNWTTLSGITSSTYTLTGLTSGQAYNWQLRRVCDATTRSEFGSTNYIWFSCAQPNQYQTQQITRQGAVLSWNQGAADLGYDIQYRTLSGTGSWTTITGLTSSTYALSGLVAGQLHEWKVRATCAAGNTAPFGPAQSFITQCNGQLSKFQATFTITGAVALNWSAQGSTGHYELQYRPLGSSDWISKLIPADELEPTYTSTPGEKTHLLYGLASNRSYEWRVRGVCGPESIGAWENGPLFTVDCPPVTAYSGAQVDNSQYNALWYSRNSTDSYQIRWRAVGEPNWQSDATAQTSYSLLNLKAGVAYEYQVQRVCTATVSSDYAASTSFTLAYNQPESVYAQASSASSIDLQWSYGKATSDELRQTAFTIRYRLTTADDWTTVGVPAGQAIGQWPQLTRRISGLQYEKDYEFSVRAERGGLVSAFSYPVSARSSCQSPISLAAQVNGGTTAQLNWYGNQQSLLQWRLANTTAWTSVTVTVTMASSGYASYALTGLSPDKTYEWRVGSLCWGNYPNAFTTGTSFRTGEASTGCTVQPVTYVIASPASSLATITWGFAYGTPFSGSAIVQYRAQNTVTWTSLPPRSTTTASLTGLMANTPYEVRVRTYCEADGAWLVSAPTPFRTVCLPITSIGVTSNPLTSVYWQDSRPAVVQWRPLNGSDWSETPVVNSPVTLTGLSAATTYQYRLQAVCDGNARSAYSSISTFQTGPTVDDVGSLYSSSGTPTAVQLYITYGGSQAYRVQWREASATSWNSTGALATKALLLQGLAPGTNYVARLAITADNGAVTYTKEYAFTTSLLTVSDLSVNYATATKVWLSWRSSADNTVLQWRTAGEAVWNTTLVISSKTYALTGLTANAPYEWRVAPTINTVPQGYSPINRFMIACPAAYELTVGRMSPTAVVLQWRSQQETGSYLLRYRVAGTSTWTERIVTGATGVTLTELTEATTYDVMVASSCTNNRAYLFSTPLRFTTQCDPATYLTVSASDTKAFLSWRGGGISNVLWWRAVDAATWNKVIVEGQSITLTDLVPNITYQWQVRSSCAPDVEDAYRSGPLFTPNCSTETTYWLAPTPVSANSVKLDWYSSIFYPSYLLKSYTIRWRKKGETGWNTVANVMPPYLLTGLPTNQEYECQVSIACSENYGETRTFALRCGSVSYLRAAQLDATSAQLTWADEYGGDRYALQWRPAGTRDWNTVSGLTSREYTLTGLTSGGSYEWQVRSTCANVPYEQTALIKLTGSATQGLYTVKAGNWNDPATWSCSCVPATTDAVLLRHAVTIPANGRGAVKQVRYEANGQLRMGSGASLTATRQP